MRIKYSSTTNKPYTIIKNKKYFGFSLHKLPRKFASKEGIIPIIESKNPIKEWFNYKGLVFINQENFKNIFGEITIE